MNVITRKSYAQKIDSWLGKGQIIVLVGQRRIGKSYMLKDFVERHKNDDATNIIYIDKEKKSFKSIATNDDLEEYIEARLKKEEHNYILIDEVQDIAGWEHTVRNYRTEENIDVIITGSNSKMLSGELGTLLGGRYEEIYIQSLSYLEFLEFHNLSDSDDSLWKYLNFGGLPGLRVVGRDDETMVDEYLSNIFNTVILKDIILRHNIRNLPFLNNLLVFLADTMGKINSASSISKYMKAHQQDVSTNAVLNYISFYQEAYLFDQVDRFDIHGKKLLESNSKYYFGDIGLRNFIAESDRSKDIEKVLENVVYQHLRRLGYKVYVGQLRAGEIDFVCTKKGERVYVQVSYIIGSDETYNREFGALRNINDDYPKFVISASPLLQKNNDNGIIHLHIREFLKNGLT